MMKTALREMQTLHAGCSKAEPEMSPATAPPPLDAESTLAVVKHRQTFWPTADPLPGGAGWPKFKF